jgi:glycosyltransferase involved in cell wall biosynthesis
VRTVHQLLPVLSDGDAIGGVTFRTADILAELGYGSRIWADVIDKRLAHRASLAKGLGEALRPGDVILYRLSIGSPLADVVERTCAPVVIVYHNITPARYFEAVNPRVTYWLERGRADLRRLAPRAALVIGDSTLNAEEARQAGARRVAVVPPPVVSTLPRLANSPLPQSTPTLLFVGRIAANKRHDDLFRVLAALRGTTHPTARLVCAGHAVDNELHLERLRHLADRLGVVDAVELTGKRISDAALAERYAGSHVFVCASEHEGFGVPLLEAMSFSLPIVAYAAAAVPETVGDGGIILTCKDPLVWAGVIGRVLDDAQLRARMVSAGRRRLGAYSDYMIRTRLDAALRYAGVTPADGS